MARRMPPEMARPPLGIRKATPAVIQLFTKLLPRQQRDAAWEWGLFGRGPRPPRSSGSPAYQIVTARSPAPAGGRMCPGLGQGACWAPGQGSGG